MEIEPHHLKQLSKDISSTLGTHLGEFRRASDTHNKNIGNIVKDISKMFASQKRTSSDLNDSIEEVHQSTQQTATKIDQTNNILQETITVQNNILNEMRSMNSSFRSLNDNMQTNNAPGLINSLLESKFGTILKGLGFGLATLAGVKGVDFLGNNYLNVEKENAERVAQFGGEVKGKGTANFQSIAPRLMADLQKDFPGMTKEDAAAIIGNLSEESGGFTKMKEGGGGPGRGWAQWTSPERKAKFLANVEKHGGDLENYDANYETLKNELKGEFAHVVKKMMATQGAANKAYVFMDQFENPNRAMAHMDVRQQETQRALNLSTDTKNAVAQDASPQSKPEAMTSGAAGGGENTSPPAEKVNPERHAGIISGAMGEQGSGKPNGEQGKLGTVNPGILAKFKEVQSQAGIPLNVTSGFRDPAHNAAVGGAKNSAHTRGNAVDVTFGGGIPETLKMIDIASKSGVGGIGVYRPGVLHFDTESKRAWGPDYHRSSVPQWAEKAIEGHLSGTGSTGPGGKGETTPGSGGSDATPQTKTPATPGMENTVSQGGAAGSESSESSGGESAAAADPEMKSFLQNLGGGGMGGMGGMMGGMGGMGGMMGMMGGMGGMGGMMGMAMPMLQQLMSSNMNPAKFVGGGDQQASMNAASINASQLEQQLHENATTQTLIEHFRKQDRQTEESSVVQGNSGQLTVNDYNGPEDIGWPDWAAHLGISGSKYKELDKIKIY